MKLSTAPYKGSRDFYPEDKRIQKYMFNKLRQVAEKYGYQEYDAPLIELSELYLSKSSNEIINEQTYSFTDRGGREVTLRPEMTPSVSRMVAAKRQDLAYPLRWYSIPNLWRYERPQAGRLREHWQLNVDLFGVGGIAGDHEIIKVADEILKSFKANSSMYEIKVNSRKFMNDYLINIMGLPKQQLAAAFGLIDKIHKYPNIANFAEDFDKIIITKKKKSTNLVMRLWNDAESGSLALALSELPYIKQLQQLLADSGIKITLDPLLTRGFDYYTDVVFEVFDSHPDNNRAMAGGGRYDGLVGLFGVEPLPTVGFAIGDVTLQRFLKLHGLIPELSPETLLNIILVGDVYAKAQHVLDALRAGGINIAVDSSGRKLDGQLKHAVKSKVRYSLVIGDYELKTAIFNLKDMLQGSEKQLSLDQIISYLNGVKVIEA